jgi:hypothetical protein
MAEGDRQQLIGPASWVIAALAVDDVEEISFIGVPETIIEGFLRTVCVSF